MGLAVRREPARQDEATGGPTLEVVIGDGAEMRPLRVAVFTTSYPRHEGDFAGRFVYESVRRMRERGLEIIVVSPQSFSHFGLADGGGLVRNLKRRPWLAPLFLASALVALRRAARTADVVHAHWLLSGVVAALAGRPFVLTLHGSGTAGRFADVELARRWPRLVGAILRRARVVVCVSEPLAEAARGCGARNVRVIANGVEVPEKIGEEAEPAEVLYAGRLSAEKGIEELVAATGGMNLVVAGDGPLREVVPWALGFLTPDELAERYARAAVVVCPSLSEGFGVVCAEAMAHGKPVVASDVGGLATLVQHERTGLLVPPGDPVALRAAIERLLADPELRARYGRAGRERIRMLCSWDRVVGATIAAYDDVSFRELPASATPALA